MTQLQLEGVAERLARKMKVRLALKVCLPSNQCETALSSKSGRGKRSDITAFLGTLEKKKKESEKVSLREKANTSFGKMTS